MRWVERMEAAGRHEAAAFGMDPGCCACPACRADYWQWGSRIECLDCGFRFPTDAWPMYSWGVQAGMRERPDGARMAHPYYRYGFEHPVEGDIYGTFERLKWGEIFPNDFAPKGGV